MRFVTRKNAAVDRIACPWLILRFVDKDAEFLYVESQDVARVAAEQDAVPFDVEGAELGHVNGRCSFESASSNTAWMTQPCLGWRRSFIAPTSQRTST